MPDNKPCPGVEFLLINRSNEKADVLYTPNAHPFKLPEIGSRPPYYCNPRCEMYYPII